MDNPYILYGIPPIRKSLLFDRKIVMPIHFFLKKNMMISYKINLFWKPNQQIYTDAVKFAVKR